MSVNSYLTFKGITNIGEDTLLPILEGNIKSFYDWAFLKVGGWSDIEIPNSGIYGGDFSKLRLVNDDSYTDGQVWEGVRREWVWETGINYVNGTGTYNPIEITGVNVNGSTYGTGHATYGFHVDYPLGRIVFTSAIATTGVVKCNHSYRNVQVYTAEEAPWFRELQFRSHRPDDTHFSQTSSGDWSVGANHRVQMPCIVVEGISRGENAPYEIGNGSLYIYQDIVFNIFSENKYMRDKLIDICRMQDDKTIRLYDTNLINESGAYPLDYRGMLVGTKMYPDLVTDTPNGFRWGNNNCRFLNVRVLPVEPLSPNLYEGRVLVTTEVILAGI